MHRCWPGFRKDLRKRRVLWCWDVKEEEKLKCAVGTGNHFSFCFLHLSFVYLSFAFCSLFLSSPLISRCLILFSIWTFLGIHWSAMINDHLNKSAFLISGRLLWINNEIQWASGTLGFPGGLVVKNLPAMYKMHARGAGSIPGSGRSSGEGNGNSLQYFCPGKPMDRGAWWATVHGVAKESGTT